MKAPSFLSVSEVENVCYVRLNRPDVRNAFNPEMIDELTENFQPGRQTQRSHCIPQLYQHNQKISFRTIES